MIKVVWYAVMVAMSVSIAVSEWRDGHFAALGLCLIAGTYFVDEVIDAWEARKQ